MQPNARSWLALTASAQPEASPSAGDLWRSVAEGVSWFFSSLSPAVLWAVLGVVVCALFFRYYWHCLKPRPNSLEWIAMSEAEQTPRRMSLTLPHHPMERKDLLPLLVLTAVYAFTAFFNLGDTKVPQQYLTFHQGDSYTFTFDQPVTVDQLSYYTCIGTGEYELAYSQDGTTWNTLTLYQNYDGLLKWQVLDLSVGGGVTASQWQITATKAERFEGVWLSELALWSQGKPLVPDSVSAGGEALFDETELWANKSTYLNSSYFDEIYHPRTAIEHLNNVYPYEVSHPPLGKLIISLGISLFGMTPFGWRFMGTLFGVLMVPILYVFLKNLFGKTPVALCGTCLFTFDFMHLVQTRIATIDTYGVFFILVSYYFMYRWLSLPAGTPLRRTALPLFLSGLFWGIGCASKWTVIYAGAGLAVLWLLGLIFKYREWPRSAWRLENTIWGFVPFAAGTTLLSLVCFVAIPVVIYVASYLPYATAQAAEYNVPLQMHNLLDLMWNNQVFMFTYHQGVTTPHPYSSSWYQWIVDARPILYYRDLDLVNVNGTKSLFAAFNNPLVSWAGLLSFFAVLIQTVRRRCGTGLFLVIGTLSQFVPWLPIGRILFAYHYFPTILFLSMTITYLMNDMFERRREGYRLAVYGFTGGVVGVYFLFYPALTGLYMPTWYADLFLRWLPSWPL